DAVLFSLFLLFICWSAFIMDEFLGYHLKSWGLKPRVLEGLPGIFSIHFLHGDLDHITQNSMAFFVLNSFLFYFYRTIALPVFLTLMLLSPALLWFAGREGNHIGASVLIYAEFAFLFLSGIIRDNPLLKRVALVVVLYYGSLVWYVFPVDKKISWEGHACGFFVGAIAAFFWRKDGPQRKMYRFEMEPELPDDDNAYWKIPSEEKPHQATTVSVKYHYTPERKNDSTQPQRPIDNNSAD
ncbi:MAG: rhomboid family intramembrane serine protease, partial [Flavobacteriales bacterium]